MITKSCNGLEEWLWERFYFRSHSQLRCLGLLPLRRRRRAASCAKLSDRVRLVTVAPTLSPMPNGKRYSGASGTAEFASSAIAFRRIDDRLKPRLNASARASPRASPTTREASGIRQRPAAPLHRACRRTDQIEVIKQRARRKNFAPGVVALVAAKKDGERLRRPFQNTSIELFIGRWL